jgi:hypothetical protein
MYKPSPPYLQDNRLGYTLGYYRNSFDDVHLIFTMHAIKNHYGFPSCPFSKRLRFTTSTLIDAGVPHTIITHALQLVKTFNTTLTNHPHSPNTQPLIKPINSFKELLTSQTALLTKLVKVNANFEGANKKKVVGRLQMEIKLRVLVPLH